MDRYILAFQSQSWCTDEEGHARVPVEHCDYKRIIEKKRAFKRTPSSYFIKPKLTSVEIQENSSATLENANEVHIILHHFSN